MKLFFSLSPNSKCMAMKNTVTTGVFIHSNVGAFSHHGFCTISEHVTTVKKVNKVLVYYENGFDLTDGICRPHFHTLRTAILNFPN